MQLRSHLNVDRHSQRTVSRGGAVGCTDAFLGLAASSPCAYPLFEAPLLVIKTSCRTDPIGVMRELQLNLTSSELDDPFLPQAAHLIRSILPGSLGE